MFIDLKLTLCQNKENKMFDQEILHNYAGQILGAKYKQVDTNKVAAEQKTKYKSMSWHTTSPGRIG